LRSLNRLLPTRSIPVLVFGLGGVGRALLKQILDSRPFFRERFNLELAIVCLTDSRGTICAEAGSILGDEVLRSALSWKQGGQSLVDHAEGQTRPESVELVRRFCRPGCLVVDCTATEETTPALIEALSRGGKVVLSNKRPLTSDQELFRSLTMNPALCRWETTVGSSLPIITSLNRIISSGDKVTRIAGTFSGTLGLLMTRLQEGASFSRVVAQAVEAGFTEPDPREDLAGTDVARKSLILARGIGWTLNLQDVKVQAIVPGALESIPVREFLARLPEMDEYFSVRTRASQKHGRVLRYVAAIEEGRCQVGLDEVPLTSPLGRLKGNDNLVEVYTHLYDPSPLVIQGRGTGVPATASGVLSDIVELAFTSDGEVSPT
jgi:homoserine dehydrogenase